MNRIYTYASLIDLPSFPSWSTALWRKSDYCEKVVYKHSHQKDHPQKIGSLYTQFSPSKERMTKSCGGGEEGKMTL